MVLLFFEPSHRSLSAIQSKAPETDLKEDPVWPIPPELLELSQTWPCASDTAHKADTRRTLESQLPSKARATALIESYLQNVGWYCMPVNRSQLMEDIVPVLYPNEKSDSASHLSAQELTMTFSVFACGAAADRTQKQDNEEGWLFYHLARSSLSLDAMLENASLSTVQTLVLMALYMALSGRTCGVEASWKWTSFAANIAASVSWMRHNCH